MTKMQGHLVTFAAATDLEETIPGYSEIESDLPSGICEFNETAVDKNGHTYLVHPDGIDGYEARKEKWARERSACKSDPNKWVEPAFKKIKGYKGLSGLELMCLKEKMAERSYRNSIAQKVREAKTKTKEDAIAILEEFHRAPHACRKITALNLECMKEVREIRKKEALRLQKLDWQKTR